MIVNSHPYNPSQQQQRCIGLNQPQLSDSAMSNSQSQHQNQNRIATQSQQNSLYGSAFNSSSGVSLSNQTSAATMSHHQVRQSHMFDLANLQQSVFDSVSGGDDSSAAMMPTSAGGELIRNKQQQRQNGDSQQQQQQQNDISFYSPSSSASLLYHIYDQINSPNEQQNYQQRQLDQINGGANKKGNNSTTILNPANLFDQQQQLPMTMQMHQHQMSGELPQRNQQQQACYPSQYQILQQQQQPFNNTLNPMSYNEQQSQMPNLMLDTIMRQHHAASTLARQNRPLSSSGNSSMSGNSMGITYGRHPRTMNSHHHHTSATKSHNNLASALQSSNTLSHLGLGLGLGPNSQLTVGSSSGIIGGGGGGKRVNSDSAGECYLADKWERINQRARRFAYEYQTVLKFSTLLILVAFSLVSIIKFTLMSASNTPATSSTTIQLSSSQQANPSNMHAILASNNGMGNTLVYPSTKFEPPIVNGLPFQSTGHPMEQDESTQLANEQRSPDKSRLVLGEFVISSQNYTQSEPERRLLAERIIRLMETVFLSSELRRYYSRMEITSIRANRPSGIKVNCNIILSESIPYAAQQFGSALYDSLAESHDRLANQANYIIDKRNILFNTVPDKDLKSIAPFIRSDIAPIVSHSTPLVAPPFGGLPEPPTGNSAIFTDAPNSDTPNSVVWSEWSQWSSCINKNGLCDPTRHHSRLRKCVAQHTGEKVDANQCKMRFDMQDQELELADCSETCRSSPQPPSAADPFQSDAPITAPSVLTEPDAFGGHLLRPQLKASAQQQVNLQVGKEAALVKSVEGPFTPSSSPVSSTANADQLTLVSTTEQSNQPDSANLTPSSSSMPTIVDHSQVSCSNCTSDEICLLLASQKVPFCAKIKDRADDSGCGGWCKSQNQLCQPAGSNAFKCIQDSDVCLADEWRCHNNQCIPLSRRCDGHYNCYDNTDERDCPIQVDSNAAT